VYKLPDWKNPAQYPKPGKTSNEQFAWEFLRRNQAYQADWAAYIAKLRAGAKSDAELLRLIDAMAAAPEEATKLWEEFKTPAKRNEVFGRLAELPGAEVTEKLDDQRTISVPLERYLGAKWGLEHVANPAWRFDNLRVQFRERKSFIQTTSHGVHLLEMEAQKSQGLPPGVALSHTRWLILQVDLEMPLEVIAKTVLGGIRQQREYRTKNGYINPVKKRARNPTLLVEYLRILDARARDVTFPHIGEVLRPRENNKAPDYTRNKRLKAAYKEACRIRDKDYLVLQRPGDRVGSR
jgi:transcriptional regulator